MRPADTSAEAHEVQLQVWRRMTPSERADAALALSLSMRDLARAGIRSRHPDYTPEQVERALLGLLYPGLAERALGRAPEPP
jgi:hypothetical protein